MKIGRTEVKKYRETNMYLFVKSDFLYEYKISKKTGNVWEKCGRKWIPCTAKAFAEKDDEPEIIKERNAIHFKIWAINQKNMGTSLDLTPEERKDREEARKRLSEIKRELEECKTTKKAVYTQPRGFGQTEHKVYTYIMIDGVYHHHSTETFIRWSDAEKAAQE